MYMEDREWEAIRQSEDKGIMMGTTITIKLKGQSVFFFTFSAIRSIEKVLHLPKKSTSRF